MHGIHATILGGLEHLINPSGSAQSHEDCLSSFTYLMFNRSARARIVHDIAVFAELKSRGDFRAAMPELLPLGYSSAYLTKPLNHSDEVLCREIVIAEIVG